jgi:hypothetical protein
MARAMLGWSDERCRPTDGRERRASRSSDPLLALSRLLEAARRDASVEAMAVADPTGCLVAGAGVSRVCEELAAHAPLLPANDTVPTRLDVLARPTQLRRLCIDGVEVLLACRGDDRAALAALDQAAAGCHRILGRT